MNRKLGQIGSLVAGGGTLAFAVSLVVGFFTSTLFVSCFASMLIAVGYLGVTAALAGEQEKADRKGVGYAAMAFGTVYAVLVLLVYYAQCTTLRLNPPLGPDALGILSYERQGSLYFNYDLLGYSFMGLSTFLAGFMISPAYRGARALRWLLWLHGIFFPACFIMPMFPVFINAGGGNYGSYMLLGWCAYFLPLCLMMFGYFHRRKQA